MTAQDQTANLPGYEEAQEIVNILKNAGLSDQEINTRLLELETVVQGELVEEILGKMNDEQLSEYDKFLETNPSPSAVAEYLKLDKEELTKRIKEKVSQLRDQLIQNLAKIKS